MMSSIENRSQFVGGPQHIDVEPFSSEMTDSGSSSLRLLLQTPLKTKKFLIPDFNCECVERVLEQNSVDFSYYKVDGDLSINSDSVERADFDVLYFVRYFGMNPNLDGVSKDKYLIDDSVFQPFLEQPLDYPKWSGFNSFRKIAPVSDGSILKSTLKLPEICSRIDAEYVEIDYSARVEKGKFLKGETNDEDLYVNGFKVSEVRKLDLHEPSPMSKRSYLGFLNFISRAGIEFEIRRKNFNLLLEHLPFGLIKKVPKYPSYFPIRVLNRDELVSKLRSQKVFLPVHWPNPRRHDNPLYKTTLSIPVDSRYGTAELSRVIDLIFKYSTKP